MSLTPIINIPSSSDSSDVFEPKAIALFVQIANMVTEINAGLATAYTSKYLKIQDQKASGIDAGASVAGSQVRTLNTVVANEIAGASLASNTITLPAGTYRYRAEVPAYGNVGGSKAKLVSTSGTTVAEIGTTNYSNSTGTPISVIVGKITLTQTTTLQISHYTSAVVGTSGLGKAATSGDVEIYTQIEFWSYP